MAWDEIDRMNRMYRKITERQEMFRDVEKAVEAAKPVTDAMAAIRRDLDGPVGRALRDLNDGPVARALRDLDRLRNL